MKSAKRASPAKFLTLCLGLSIARKTAGTLAVALHLAQPAVPEHRESMAIGLLNDVEIGQPSDIASILYGG